MGSCLSCLEDDNDGRGYVPNRQTVYSYSPPVTRPRTPLRETAPTTTTRTSLSSYNSHSYNYTPKPGALYGEYKCGGCKYFWVSRLSWRDKYQLCKRCKASVRPRFQRELVPSDFKSRDEVDDSMVHPKELCEMCKQVGGYCGRYK